MENASKALLIAAGVLIVILIIAMSMRIYNGTGDVASDAEQVGESIKESSTDASKEAISSLKDIKSKNLLNIPNHMEEVKNYNYNITRTNVYLEPNKTYLFKFDYKVEEKPPEGVNIYASIGVRNEEEKI